jgi:processive 1,2-diacylglycerol beta-glucosyltransferase
MPSPRILIVTAAFGEGHNSAAKNLALGLNALGATVKVADPCMESTPIFTDILCKIYRFLTTYTPNLWYKIYLSTDDMDFSRQSSTFMRKPENALAQMIEDFQPDAIVSTYPIYPYFLHRILATKPLLPIVLTVITDSFQINASWKKAPTDAWLVTDEQTRNVLLRVGMPEEKVIDTGFPVHPCFSSLTPTHAEDPLDSFRILYFPTAKKPHVRRISRALLDASPLVHLTLVLGKNVRRLYRQAHEIKKAYPGRVRIIGWTRRVPQLLAEHHLIVGKAGGATVHEAIAAQCPMIVFHLVPGQEEGNLQLLQSIGCGKYAKEAHEVRAIVGDLLADNASLWRSMKRLMAAHPRHSGALHAARYVLQRIADRPINNGTGDPPHDTLE